MTVVDFLLLIASVLVWLLLMLIWPLLAVWLILPAIIAQVWLIVKNMEVTSELLNCKGGRLMIHNIGKVSEDDLSKDD